MKIWLQNKHLFWLPIRSAGGFSSVDLVVTIVIIFIITSVAVPVFISLNDRAKAANCRANQAALQAAVNMALAQNAMNGNPAFPATLTEVESYMTINFTLKCTDGESNLHYDNRTGAVWCENHPR